MLTLAWGLIMAIWAIWGVWDWRVAVTGWIVTVVYDVVSLVAAFDDSNEDGMY